MLTTVALHAISFRQWLIPSSYLNFALIAILSAMIIRWRKVLNRWLIILLSILLILLSYILSYFQLLSQHLAIDKPLPDLAQLPLTTSNQTANYYLILLWRSDCPLCYQQSQHLASLMTESFLTWTLLCINEGDSFLRAQQDLPPPCALNRWDQHQRLAQALSVYGLPLTLLATAQGKILSAHLGLINRRRWQQMQQQAYQRIAK